MKNIVLTVSQLTQAIKLSLESTFSTISLQGEISNCKLQSSGHLYFSLKDSQAQISAVMFRGDVSHLKSLPKDGDQVTVRGELNVYPPTGKYQIIVRDMQHVGLGALLLRLEELKAKLEKKGWFSKEHKKPLPKHPKVIGVVTSPTGAVIQDILNILTRRYAGFKLILNPVKVQGEGSAQEIAQAIDQFNKYQLADVIIVGRGGGSIEDLWSFNEEVVAEAIFNSKIPIISAVGHETDYCIADFVADVRAPTPSAAAELVSAETSQQIAYLAQLEKRCIQALAHLIRQTRNRLVAFQKQPIFQSPYALIGAHMQRIDESKIRMDELMKQQIIRFKMLLDARKKQASSLNPMNQMIHYRDKLLHWNKALIHGIEMRLNQLKGNLFQCEQRIDLRIYSAMKHYEHMFNREQKEKQLQEYWRHQVQLRQERLKQLSDVMMVINPKNLLSKGYCIAIAEKDQSVITSTERVKKSEEMRLILADGEILSTIKEIKYK